MTTTDNSNIYQIVLDAMTSAPVNLDGLASRLGIVVLRTQLPDQVSGAIEKLPAGNFRILVNANHAETRQRFTVAHEIGHFVSHRHLLGSGTNDSRAYRTVATQAHFNPAITAMNETEANRFAAALLMPEQMVQDWYNKLGRPSHPEQMAALFRVSPQAMQIRLDGLRRRGCI